MLPGASTWYLSLALSRLVLELELEHTIDGSEATQRFRRIEQKAAKDFGQDFWVPHR
jgi:hypothetical protein